MADYDSSLPVRTEEKGDVVSKIVDTAGVNELVVEADGSINTNTDVTLTPADDGVLIHGSDDGGTTPRVVLTDAAGNVSVIATDLDIRDLDSSTDSVTIANTAVTPVYVEMVTPGAAGDEVVDYQTTATVAKNASTTHSFSHTADIIGKYLVVSGSGKLKAEIKYGTTGAEVTKYVLFNSTADPNIKLDLKDTKLLSSETIQIIITNRDNQPQDVYSTFRADEL